MIQEFLRTRKPLQPLRTVFHEEGLSAKEFHRLTGLTVATVEWNFWGCYNELPDAILDYFEDPQLPDRQNLYRVETRLSAGRQLRPSELAGKPRLQLAKAFCVQPAQILRFEKNERALPSDIYDAMTVAYPDAPPVVMASWIFKNQPPL